MTVRRLATTWDIPKVVLASGRSESGSRGGFAPPAGTEGRIVLILLGVFGIGVLVALIALARVVTGRAFPVAGSMSRDDGVAAGRQRVGERYGFGFGWPVVADEPLGERGRIRGTMQPLHAEGVDDVIVLDGYVVLEDAGHVPAVLEGPATLAVPAVSDVVRGGRGTPSSTEVDRRRDRAPCRGPPQRVQAAGRCEGRDVDDAVRRRTGAVTACRREGARVKLCLTGDLMSGRGIDQILRHPGDPKINERWLQSAVDYVALAEQKSGPIPRRVPAEYVWGHALDVVEQAAPVVFVVNVETAVTDRGSPWPDKGIQYRMHPTNVDILPVAGVDVAVLANNHVLDWSVPGLNQTIDVIRDAGAATVGAGRDSDEAWRPAAVPTTSGSRVLIFAAGSPSSGIPPEWAAGEHAPGIAYLPELSDHSVDDLAAIVHSWTMPGDVVVLSLHWGPNWGYEINPEHQRFARALIDHAGVHVVHGHSSHHPLGIEVHHGRLILYGCGDLLTDYEGIRGHQHYRGELGAVYIPTIDDRTGALERLEIAPTKVERFQLTRPSADDVQWLAAVLDREGASLGTTVTVADDDRLVVRW